jgi:hypothetical protein
MATRRKTTKKRKTTKRKSTAKKKVITKAMKPKITRIKRLVSSL